MIYTARCQTYNQDVIDTEIHDCLKAFGGANTILEKGKRGKDSKTVLIKANLVKSARIDEAATTHPAVIEAVAREFSKLGATVLIGDCPAINQTTSSMHGLYRVTGMAQAAERTNSTLIYDFNSQQTICQYTKNKRTFPIWTPVFDADIIINCAKLKTHSFAVMTGAVKNLFGVIPGLMKSAKHAENMSITDFSQMIVDLCECVQSITPVFSIIDGIVGMEGKGPTGGTPKVANALIASDSPYTADLAGIEIMGLKPDLVPIIHCAIKRGLMPSSLNECECNGTLVKDLVTPFKTPRKTNLLSMALSALSLSNLFGGGGAYPHIDKKRCIACGKCVEICPVHAATNTDGILIDRKKCIRCYCCHEVCPARAIDI